jgi:glycosyltransferase involved in cell wall biosynthesis
VRITQVVVTDAFAGTERYVVEVANRLADRGHDVQVLGGAAGTMPGLLESAVRWAPAASLQQAVAALARGGRRDIVHSHLTKGDFAAFLAVPATGGRRVATRHILMPRGYGAAAQRFGRLVTRGLACEIAVSRFVADGVETPCDEILLNGVRSTAGGPVASDRSRTVLVAQRLAEEKATDVALRAWAASGLGQDGWSLVVAGGGPERPALEELAAELGVAASVTFAGWVSDLPDRFARAAGLLAPAPAEPLGFSVQEAMAVGLPVVASDAGGHAETVGTVAGALLFPPGDVAACATALRRLAGDGGQRVAYGARLQARQREAFELEGHVTALEKIYAAVARPGREPRGEA